jgi:hypothetical protein
MRAWVVLLVGCSAPAKPRGFERDIDVDQRRSEVNPDAQRPPDDVLDARSVASTANAPVRAEPTAASARIGILGREARAKAVQARPPGEGCAKRWIEIAPRGWVCEANLGPTNDAPTEATAVALDDTGDPGLGTYGTVRGDGAWMYEGKADLEANGGVPVEGSLIVRSTGVVSFQGERFWMTSNDALISTRWITPIPPSTFRGVAVRDGELRVAWAHRAGRPKAEVPVRAAARADARATGVLPPRSQVDVVEWSPDNKFARIGEAGWVARSDLRVPVRTEPPFGVAPSERWFDVDLDEQILVAYEGPRPVYTTLVSSGRAQHRTSPGLTRIALKMRTTTMSSAMPDDSYSVADVPWTMFYTATLALHGAYWHDGFGEVRSHGCVNLAPRDARVLFDWASPAVPPGWTAVYADAASPGSVIRLRAR